MKTKLTLSVDRNLLKEAKSRAAKRHLTLSGLIDEFLAFFTRPQLYCFKCGGIYDVETSKVCPKCEWSICPRCQTCKCQLGEEASKVAFHMRKVYENLVGGRLMLEGEINRIARAAQLPPKTKTDEGIL